MRTIQPMSSPKNTNRPGLYLLKVPVAAELRGLAIDELPAHRARSLRVAYEPKGTP